jgi:hypothetical protein
VVGVHQPLERNADGIGPGSGHAVGDESVDICQEAVVQTCN